MDYLANDYLLLSMLSDHAVMSRPAVRAINSLQELSEVYRLTHECYVKNEYAAPHSSGMLIHYPYFDHHSSTSILIARLHGKIVGSVSVTIDGPGGLTVDEDFKDVCDQSRVQGRQTAAVWRLVVDEEHRGQREIVIAMIREVIRLLRKHNVQDCFFAVNPRHVAVYQKMLNMEIVAEKPATHGLSNAPAILLRGDPFSVPGRLAHTDHVASPISMLLSINPF